MKDYYQILGVGERATDREIKQAHRQLVLLLHPDRTPDPTAQARFLDVQEAYEVLGDYHRRLAYDLIRAQARELIRQAQLPKGPSPYDPPPAPPRPRAPDPLKLLLAKYAPWAYRVSWVITLFCFSLLLDWALPLREYANEPVVGKRVIFVSTSRSNPQNAYVVSTPHTEFKLRDDLGGTLHQGQLVTVWRTPLWRIVRRVQPRYQAAFRPYGGNIYGTLSFWPMLLFAVSAVGLLPHASDELRVNAATSGLIVLIITLFMLSA